jgi:hypothetical protein
MSFLPQAISNFKYKISGGKKKMEITWHVQILKFSDQIKNILS